MPASEIKFFCIGEKICDKRSMSEFTLLIKEYAKNSWMTYFFRRDSAVWIRWTLY